VIQGTALCLAHLPDLVRHGSKPVREIAQDPDLLDRLEAHRRSFADAVAYPPNQVFIGNLAPEDLWETPEPWHGSPVADASRRGPDGEVMPQEEFFCLMAAVDDFDLFLLTDSFVAGVLPDVAESRLITDDDIAALGSGVAEAEVLAKVDSGAAIPIHHDGQVVGCMMHGHPEDASLVAGVLLENLAAKASGVLALRRLVADVPETANAAYVFGCGEEAVGDRYQRGGGNLAKAIAEASGLRGASGSDIKAFCCAPNHAIVIGAGLVAGGLFDSVVVVGGGSLAKLGMKYQGHLKGEMPILEDVLASTAILIGADDGVGPVIDLDAIGKHDVAAGTSPPVFVDTVVVKPLRRVGLGLADVDRYATELHNPEVTVPQGSGNVPERNYRILASVAARNGEIDRNDIDAFAREKGMPGFSPTQGHIASAIPYLGHARRGLTEGSMNAVFLYAKGSLFLGRMTKLSDGFSFLLRRNPAGRR
jgi:betaine reductase